VTHPMLIWLESCLDAEERIALAAQEKALSPWRNSNGLVKHSGPPESGHGRDDGLWDDEGTSGMKVDHQLCMLGEVADHVALHDPAAVLAVVEAHRVLLAIHTPNSFGYCTVCGWDDGYESTPHEAWPCPTVRALASAYRHAPGWDEAWGPT
jgi:hypothetical protein